MSYAETARHQIWEVPTDSLAMPREGYGTRRTGLVNRAGRDFKNSRLLASLKYKRRLYPT